MTQPNSRAIPSQDRSNFNKTSWAVLGLVVLILVLNFAQVLYRFSLPSDGWTFPLELGEGVQQYIFGQNLTSAPSSLKTGDVLIAIEGQSIEESLGRAISLNPERPLNWAIGQTVQYTILREGQELTLDIPIIHRPIWPTIQHILGVIFVGFPSTLPQLLIAFFIFYWRPRSDAARLLLLYSIGFFIAGVNQPLSGELGGTTELFYRGAYWPAIFFSLLIFPLFIVPSLPHLFLIFPVKKKPMRCCPHLILAVIYGLPPTLLLIGFLRRFDQPLTVWRSTLELGGSIIFPLSVLTIVISLIHTLVTIGEPVGRAQARWLTAGVLVGIGIGQGALFFLPELGLLEAGFLTVVLAGLFGLAFPLSLAVAILRYRLWDIDIIINRTLVYGTLTGLLIVLFGSSLFVISGVFQAFTSGQQSVVALVVSALFFGILFQPTRLRLQRFVDRRFYGIQIDYQPVQSPKSPFTIARPVTHHHFGTYENLELIGRGGMAEVYRAHHPTLNRPVAIKILPAQFASETDFRKRFIREAQTIAALKHPNIVQVFDFGEAENTYYMVMEHIAGPDLGDYLKGNGPLSLEQAKPIIEDIASALDYAHTESLVHRDIKPSNVMLEPITNPGMDGQQHPQRAVLMDFGIAKIVGGGTRFTQTGGVLGTFDYIAPEQIEASGEIDGRADIYALGIMVYQMLTGELPFKYHNPGALLIAHMTRPAPDPREVVPDLPREVVHALRRALAKNPTERYDTAGDFVAALI